MAMNTGNEQNRLDELAREHPDAFLRVANARNDRLQDVMLTIFEEATGKKPEKTKRDNQKPWQ